jgi:hypothetical protein
VAADAASRPSPQRAARLRPPRLDLPAGSAPAPDRPARLALSLTLR